MPEDTIHTKPHVAAVALGANVPSPAGAPRATIDAAIGRVRDLGEVVAVSQLRETRPEGPVRDQPAFVNGALLLRTALSPAELLRALLAIERALGRVREGSVPKGPRTIDLDLLFYDDLLLATAGLTLPHPAIAERRFVLEPLLEIAPEWRHPILRRTAAAMLQLLDHDAGPRRLGGETGSRERA